MEFSEDYWFSSPENILNNFYITITVLKFLDIKYCDTENSTTQIVFAQQIKTTLIFFQWWFYQSHHSLGESPPWHLIQAMKQPLRRLLLLKLNMQAASHHTTANYFFRMLQDVHYIHIKSIILRKTPSVIILN